MWFCLDFSCFLFLIVRDYLKVKNKLTLLIIALIKSDFAWVISAVFDISSYIIYTIISKELLKKSKINNNEN